METSSHSSAALAAASLKEQKELFVSGLEGTTAFELLLICSTAVTGILFFQALSTTTKQSWLAEVAAFWIPMILCQTVWLYPYGVAYLIGQMAFALLIQLSRGPIPNNEHQPKGSKLLNSDQDLRRLAVTVYRSCLMFLTVTAILAVDFHVFPRRLGKTETTGYSLMDLGAASFVIAAGIVSPRARSSQQQQQQLSADWSKRIQRMIPLLLMGSLRLLTHKELEYQEHVSEYGVHWNFFYTLALLVPVSAVMSGRTPSWVQPVATMTFYQLLLTTAGLQAWVQDAPRSCPRKNPRPNDCCRSLRILVRESRRHSGLYQLCRTLSGQRMDRLSMLLESIVDDDDLEHCNNYSGQGKRKALACGRGLVCTMASAVGGRSGCVATNHQRGLLRVGLVCEHAPAGRDSLCDRLLEPRRY